MKEYPLLFIFFCSLGFSAQSQDTLTVQTFTWADNHRADTFEFPDNPLMTFRKILMVYNMRCHNAAVGSGSVGCYEWDYSCNTFISDPTHIDSTRAEAPDYVISNFTGSSFPYSNSPTYDYTSYAQHESSLQTGSNPSVITYNGPGQSNAFGPQTKTYRYQVVIPAADLVTRGLSAGSIYGLRFSVLQAGATVGFFKIRLKNTLATTAGQIPDELDLEEVYHRNTDFSSTGDLLFPFYQAFDWSGDNLLIDVSFTTKNGTDVPVFDFFESTNQDAAIQSLPGTEEHHLYFGGAGTIDLPLSSIENIHDELTVSFWAYGDPTSLPANTQIFDGTDAGGLRQANVHLPWGNGEVYWDCGNDGSGYDRISKAANVNDYEGKWNHWAFSKNAITGDMKIFLNGALWHSGTGRTRKMNFNAFRFGQSLSNNNPYFGSIDEIQVWDLALDEATIKDWMFQQVNASHPDFDHLMAYYQLNEGSGMTLSDASGKMNDASISLPAWRSPRGNQLFHHLVKTNLWPKMAFLQGDYTITDSPVMILDSIESAQHQVIHFGLSGTDLIRLDTQFVFPAGDKVVYDENGQFVDVFDIPADGYFDIQTLVYYTKRNSKFEILSLVTPYGNGLDLGQGGKTFTFDVTDFGPILKGKRRLSIEYGGENQEELDIKFLFILGTPERDVLDIQQIWPQGRGNFTEVLTNRKFEPRQVQLDPAASHYKIRSAVTGHDQNGEFVSRQHFINLNGGPQEFTYNVWKKCSENPIYPQGGTWIFDRAGWCPGMATDVHQFSLDSYVTPGETIEIDYGINGTLLSAANYLVNNQLVTYGSYHFQVDASLEAIIRPNADQVEFARLNPACNTPTVRVKNSGAQSIQSVKLLYGTTPGNMQSYTWTGNLDRQGIVDIVLPSLSAGIWLNATTFTATILEVNGAADDNSANNVLRSNYKPVNKYNFTDLIQLRVATNGTGQDYSYRIKDGSGAIMIQRNSLNSNTVYTDDLVFPAGCYTLEFNDAGEDGLSFWFFPGNGNGSLLFQRKLTGGGTIPIYSFNPDFGAGVKYDFGFGSIISSNEEPDQEFQLFSTYPNPAKDELHIDLVGFEGRELQFRLVDMTGVTRLEQKFRSEQADEKVQINLSKLVPGMYVLHGTDGKRNWVREVVKTN